jgi:DNA repair protein RecN (Recombination protein N)
MITQLTVQNYGLIDRLTVEFGEGLNVLTGETGAGKSILIGALRYALGEKFGADQARDPKAPCVVEMVCELPAELVAEHETLKDLLAGEDALIINRTYTPDGKNKIRVNGFTLTLSQLRAVGDLLVDFHGPNDHQMLLTADTHVKILDRLCPGVRALKEVYAAHYEKFKRIERSLEEIKAGTESRERDLDLLNHQIRELERVGLESKKYEETTQKEAQLKNHEKLGASIGSLMELLEDEEGGIEGRISESFAHLRSLASVDKSAAYLEEKMKDLQELTGDILADLRKYEEKLSFDPEDARDLAVRCDAYHDILRKYGPRIEDAAEFYRTAKERRDFLVNLEHNDGELRRDLKGVEKSLKDASVKITNERQKAAKSLAKSVEAELKELGIAHVRFECRIVPAAPGRDGADEVAFYISPNLGEELKPLAEIVSSGEAARVMLALKKSMTDVDPVPVLLFDEIDAQIGGRLGTVIGGKLREISAKRQVVLITHLPQIAGFAARHFKVSKKITGDRTVTSVTLLDREARVKEMSQMMSGDKGSGVSLTHAEEMLFKAGKG